MRTTQLFLIKRYRYCHKLKPKLCCPHSSCWEEVRRTKSNNERHHEKSTQGLRRKEQEETIKISTLKANGRGVPTINFTKKVTHNRDHTNCTDREDVSNVTNHGHEYCVRFYHGQETGACERVSFLFRHASRRTPKKIWQRILLTEDQFMVMRRDVYSHRLWMLRWQTSHITCCSATWKKRPMEGGPSRSPLEVILISSAVYVACVWLRSHLWWKDYARGQNDGKKRPVEILRALSLV